MRMVTVERRIKSRAGGEREVPLYFYLLLRVSLSVSLRHRGQ